MQVDYILRFLRAHYSYAQLVALKAHAEEGKLSWKSCCCLVGFPTANHAYRGIERMMFGQPDHAHLDKGRLLPFAKDAEIQFSNLGENDAERRYHLLPIILAEMARRDSERKLKEMSVTGDLAEV